MTQGVLMDVIVAWCGFVGAWVLVAGPMYQGAVELSEMDVQRTSLRSQVHATPRLVRVSPWWWLLPPVAYVLTSRKQRAWQQQVLASLTPQQRVQFVTYANKATGWFVVGAGAALIGIKEAAALVEVLDWPRLVTIPLVVLAAAVALAFTVRRMQLTERVLHAGDATA